MGADVGGVLPPQSAASSRVAAPVAAPVRRAPRARRGGVSERPRLGAVLHLLRPPGKTRAGLIDDEQRPVIPDIGILDHRHAAIVQRQPMAVEAHGRNRVMSETDPEVTAIGDSSKVA